MDFDEDAAVASKHPYSMAYSIYCLLLITGSSMSQIWSKSAMSSFYGFGIAGLMDDEYFAM